MPDGVGECGLGVDEASSAANVICKALDLGEEESYSILVEREAELVVVASKDRCKGILDLGILLIVGLLIREDGEAGVFWVGADVRDRDVTFGAEGVEQLHIAECREGAGVSCGLVKRK